MIIPKIKNIDFLFNYKYIIISSAIILFFRIMYSLLFNTNIISVEDYTIAENLVKGNGYTLYPPTGPTAIKVPFYPILISGFIIIFGSSAKIAIVIFQHLLISAIPIIFIKIGRFIQMEKIAFITAWLFILHPSYFYYPNVIEVTNIFIFISTISLFLVIKSIKIQSTKYLIFLGIASAAILLIQPIASPIIFAVWVYLFYKIGFAKLSVIIATTMMIISPWIIRNYIEFDKFIPGKSPFWMNIYVGYIPYYHANSKFDILDRKDIDTIESLMNQGVNDVELEKYYKDISINTIKKSPILYLEKTLYQMASFWWVPPRYFDDNRLAFLLVRKIPVIMLNIMTLFGLYFMFKENKKSMLAVLSVLIFFTLVYGLTQNANIRFKLDIEWIQLIAVSYFILKIIKPLQT